MGARRGPCPLSGLFNRAKLSLSLGLLCGPQNPSRSRLVQLFEWAESHQSGVLHDFQSMMSKKRGFWLPIKTQSFPPPLQIPNLMHRRTLNYLHLGGMVTGTFLLEVSLSRVCFQNEAARELFLPWIEKLGFNQNPVTTPLSLPFW